MVPSGRIGNTFWVKRISFNHSGPSVTITKEAYGEVHNEIGSPALFDSRVPTS